MVDYRRTVAYTNHTTLSEALEKWPEDMIQTLFPRLYLIIKEINERFCKMIWFDYPELRDNIPNMAILAYNQIHMAHLAMVGSFSINGVAKLHTDILKNRVMKPFYTVFPKRFNNKTNGITHRRWLLNCNPELATVISNAIGPNWIKEPHRLASLLPFADDAGLQDLMAKVKHENKKKLANYIKQHYHITIDDKSIVDVHIKRLHGYKRQLLNVFHIIHLYLLCLEQPTIEMTPTNIYFRCKSSTRLYICQACH